MPRRNAMDKSFNTTQFQDMLESDIQRRSRDGLYTNILKHYSDNQKTMHIIKSIMKCIFFAISCFVLIWVVCIGTKTIHDISLRPDISITDLGVALTGLASILTTINIIPSTIATHLFPRGGDTEEKGLIETMQKFDNTMHTGDVSFRDLADSTDNADDANADTESSATALIKKLNNILKHDN